MIRPKIRHRHSIPYGGGYYLNLPDKGMVGGGSSFGMLVANIQKWRTANGWPVGLGLEQELEQEVCKAYPAECDETSEMVPTRHRSLHDIILGTRTLFSHKLAGSPLVSHAEAERRASVCVKCPNNIHYTTPCGGICGELKDVVNALVGGHGTKFDGALKACAICSCELTSAVWMPIDFQVEGLSDLQKSQFAQARQDYGCWKNP